MTDRQQADRGGGDLRTRAAQRAVETAASRPGTYDASSPDGQLRLVQELRLHQIELEMQNEELRRAQAELEESRARYFELYDLAPVGYFTLSAPGLILEANLTAATLLRVPRGSLPGRPLSGFVMPEDANDYHVRRTELAEQGATRSWDMRMRRGDGSSFWAHLDAAPARNGECRITLQDVSERKRTEATIARAEERLWHLQKADSLGRMAGAIAHHFNNKLQAVMGNLERAMSEPALGAESAGLLAASMQAALQAAEMSTLMLTFTGQTASSREPMDLSRACRQLLPLLRDTLPAGLSLETDLPDAGPFVLAQAEQMHQLLVNLVTNAGEAVGSGNGLVRLAVTRVSAPDIPETHRFPVDWEPQDTSYACLKVGDTGRGIAEKDLERIFDPFFTHKDVGRGLGLSVVLGVVRAHGGVISVRSEPGRGTTFRVFLPLSAEEAPPRSEKVPESEAGGTVLLVEDEDLVRSLTSAQLRRLGFSVLEAGGGPEALEVLAGHQAAIRLVLCDLTMPGMNGWETLTALRKLVPGVPAILTSGYDRARVMAGSHPELPQAFLRKPYRFADLGEAIRVALKAGPTSGRSAVQNQMTIEEAKAK